MHFNKGLWNRKRSPRIDGEFRRQLSSHPAHREHSSARGPGFLLNRSCLAHLHCRPAPEDAGIGISCFALDTSIGIEPAVLHC